jgi:recombination protein RecA
MAHPAAAVLESALRARKLDRTLTTALPPLERSDPWAFVETHLEALDACLRGGFPRGQLSEVAGPRSSGRTTLLLQVMAAATARGEVAALIDTFDRLDVASAVAAGVQLDRLLWVRGQAISKTEGAMDARWVPGETSTLGGGTGLLERTVDRALKALNLVLQAGGFGVVALDLADVPASALTRVPFTTWLRVQRAIEGSETACVLLVPAPRARSAGGLTLALAGRTTWTGSADRSRRMAGVDVRVRVISPRRRVEGEISIAAAARDSP